MYRIGIDVGGTNTDAVIMQEGKILTGVKSATTADVMNGGVESLVKALENKLVKPILQNRGWRRIRSVEYLGYGRGYILVRN